MLSIHKRGDMYVLLDSVTNTELVQGTKKRITELKRKLDADAPTRKSDRDWKEGE